MIYYMIKDSRGNILEKSLKMNDREVISLAENYKESLKDTILIFSTEPRRTGVNYYQYGYHCKYTLEYEPKKPMFIIHFTDLNGNKVDTEMLSFDSVMSLENTLKMFNLEYIKEEIKG